VTLRPPFRSRPAKRKIRLTGFPARSVNAGNDVAEPPQEKDPKGACNDEIKERSEKPTLEELT
jgi:hypothetical protein